MGKIIAFPGVWVRPDTPEKIMEYIHRRLLEDTGDFILLDWRSPGINALWPNSVYIISDWLPKTGPRNIAGFEDTLDLDTGEWQAVCGPVKSICKNRDNRPGWCYNREILHLLPPYPDRRREYLAAHEAADVKEN
ncbi:hypothetical protein AGMMS49944_08870 [Spirochaetia bacterium]|nr:hypothetical protein AGMMS49944_08870 [Spirochaetia bacterium]